MPSMPGDNYTGEWMPYMDETSPNSNSPSAIVSRIINTINPMVATTVTTKTPKYITMGSVYDVLPNIDILSKQGQKNIISAYNAWKSGIISKEEFEENVKLNSKGLSSEDVLFIEINNEAEYSLADSLFIDVNNAVKYASAGMNDSAGYNDHSSTAPGGKTYSGTYMGEGGQHGFYVNVSDIQKEFDGSYKFEKRLVADGNKLEYEFWRAGDKGGSSWRITVYFPEGGGKATHQEIIQTKGVSNKALQKQMEGFLSNGTFYHVYDHSVNEWKIKAKLGSFQQMFNKNWDWKIPSENTYQLESVPSTIPDSTGYVTIDGTKYKVFIPEYENGINSNINKNGWENISVSYSNTAQFDFWSFIGGLEGDDGMIASWRKSKGNDDYYNYIDGGYGTVLLSAVLGSAILLSVAENSSVISIRQTIQSNGSDNRVVLELFSQNVLEEPYIAPSKLLSTEYGSIQVSSYVKSFLGINDNKTYDILYTFDSAHNADKSIGYLSLDKDNNFQITAKLYPNDKKEFVEVKTIGPNVNIVTGSVISQSAQNSTSTLKLSDEYNNILKKLIN